MDFYLWMSQRIYLFQQTREEVELRCRHASESDEPFPQGFMASFADVFLKSCTIKKKKILGLVNRRFLI